MTELEVLVEISTKLDTVIWLGSACALGVGVLWGHEAWKLLLYLKNERDF